MKKRLDLAPLSDFNLNRYLGKWYEIARLDHLFERHITHATAEYSLLGADRVKVVNRGYNTKSREWKKIEGHAVTTSVAGHLKVFFNPFFPGAYNIAYISDRYDYAIVTGNTTKYLWFLARTPSLPVEQLNEMKEKAVSLGYDIESLIYNDN